MSFSHAVILLDFYARQDFIAKNLCENRNKPMSHCCGRCQLRKRLAQENNRENSTPERRSENGTEVMAFQQFPGLPEPPVCAEREFTYSLFTSSSPVDRSFDIFHPPAAC